MAEPEGIVVPSDWRDLNAKKKEEDVEKKKRTKKNKKPKRRRRKLKTPRSKPKNNEKGSAAKVAKNDGKKGPAAMYQIYYKRKHSIKWHEGVLLPIDIYKHSFLQSFYRVCTDSVKSMS